MANTRRIPMVPDTGLRRNQAIAIGAVGGVLRPGTLSRYVIHGEHRYERDRDGQRECRRRFPRTEREGERGEEARESREAHDESAK